MPYRKPVISNLRSFYKTGMERHTDRGEANCITLCEALPQIAESTGIPLTCLLVRDEAHTYKKTLFGKPQPLQPVRASSLRPADLQQAEETTHHNGIPQRLREAGSGEIDQIGGETLFAIGSLVKQVLALTCSVIIENKIIKTLTWETRVMKWIRELYGHSDFIHHIEKEIDPTIEDLFLNYDALPSMNLFLFLADGVFQVSNQDFISNLDRVFCRSRQRNNSHSYEKIDGGYEYTNANAILISMLLEKATNRSIDEIMKQYLFEPLGMSRTMLDHDKVMEMAKDLDENVSLGQRLTGGLKTTWPTASEQPYRHSTAFKMTIGMWSCTDDLAKMYNAICNALEKRPGHITYAIIDKFLRASGQKDVNGLKGIYVAPAGLLQRLDASDQGHESLNSDVRKKSGSGAERWATGRIGKGNGSVKHTVVYKGGTCDGFTATAYLHIRTRMFAIALSNASGPVDITEPIARYLLKAAVGSMARSDFQSIQNDLRDEIKEQLGIALPLWLAIEAEDRDFDEWSDDTERFAGVYEHEDHQLQIEIEKGEAHFKRLRQHGPEILTVMRVRALGNQIRLFPKQQGIFIDRLTSFRDLRLTMRDEIHGVKQLAANEDWDLFIKK